MKLPNFFIVGAPKCGTTALSEYLRSHPNVFMSTPKEPAFFCKDLTVGTLINTMEDYLALFDNAEEGHLAVGEASTWYLLSDVAAAEIKRFQPDARIIIMVRNPVDMVPSLHNQRVFGGKEDIEDFETAWRTQEERTRAGGCRPGKPDIIYFQYRRWGTLGSQVKKWLETFPRKHVKVILYDDFSENTEAVYKDVLAFLSLPNDERENFQRINQSKKKRSHLVALLLRRPPPGLLKITSFIKAVLAVQTLGLRDRLRRLNARQERREVLSEELRQDLTEDFREEILLLSQLIGRDLSPWLEGFESLNRDGTNHESGT